MAHPVVHFEVLGKDPEVLRRFYGEVFEWPMQDVMNGSYFMISPSGDRGIAGGVGAAGGDADGHVTFYVEVDDIAETLSRIAELGGATVQEPMDVPGGPTIALFRDPEGHVIGLVKGMA